MAIMKYCPYCVKPLGFVSIVTQRLFMKEKSALYCPNCGSVISSSRHAKIPLLFGGSGTTGYLLGYVTSKYIETPWTSILVGVFIGALIFLLLTYFLAPIRRA
jgi:hypothetical protein